MFKILFLLSVVSFVSIFNVLDGGVKVDGGILYTPFFPHGPSIYISDIDCDVVSEQLSDIEKLNCNYKNGYVDETTK
jgi:hypothetical protein